jgi:hypothetical protein
MPLNNAQTQRHRAAAICRKDKIPAATTARREVKGHLIARHERAGMPPGAPSTPAGRIAQPGPAGTGTGTASAAGQTGRKWPLRAAVAMRHHWLVSVLLAAGLVLRVLAVAAYHPALIYVDTLKYLYGASPGSEPLGYTVLLRLTLLAGDLGTVAVIQHLLGLAMAVTLYTVLLRRGAGRWLAVAAVAPVLLDAYQIQMEQTIMPDVWFEAMIVAALAVLLWRPTVGVPFAAAAGLILGSSAAIKQLGELLVLPAVVYLLVAGGRRGVRPAAALAVAFVLPVLCSCGISYARTGHFWLAHRQPSIGRLAAAADCATLKLPAAARPLCPRPAEQALGPDWLEHSGQSPLYRAAVPPGTRGRLIAALGSAVRHQQPVRVAAAIARDSVRLFAPARAAIPGVTPLSRWQFQAGYPTYPPWTSICPAGQLSAQECLAGQRSIQQRVAPVSDLLIRPGGTIVVGVQRQVFGPFRARALNPSYGGQVQVNRPVAAFLRAYQLGGGYTPGPLLALCALAGLAGSLLALIGRAVPGGYDRGRQLALACLLLTGTAAVVLLAPDVYEFSWRYQLPAVITLAPAGAAGIAALWQGRPGIRQHLRGRPWAGPHPGGDARQQ